MIKTLKTLKTKKWFSIVLDQLANLVGTSLYALGVHSFTSPNNIAPGGVTGISTIINYLTDMPIGTLVLLINIPLFILGAKYKSKTYAAKSFVSVLFFTVIVDFAMLKVPVYEGDALLAGIFGGVLIGAGLAIVFMRGSSTGGTDIISQLINKRFPHIQLGKIMLSIDVVVVMLSMFVYKNIETAMYALISIFVSTKVVDSMLYGIDTGRMVMIISKKHEEISDQIINRLNRGATILKGMGAYSYADTNVIMCAVRKNEFIKLKAIVNEVDPSAFMVVNVADEVLGEGFKSMEN